MLQRSFIVLATVLFCHWINKDSFGQTKSVDCTATQIEQKLQLIATESSSLDASSWEGEYLCFPGIDEAYQLFLSKKHGFVFRKVGNSGYSEGICGTIAETSEAILLKVEMDSVLPVALSPRLIVARSSERVFLIPMARFHGFCLDFKSSPTETIRGYFNKKTPNSSRKNELAVDSNYSIYLSLPEIQGEIIEIRNQATSNLDVPSVMTINLGKKNHLFVGMRFTVKWNDAELGEQQAECEVTKLQDESSFVVLIGTYYRKPSFEVGTKIMTSRFPWHNF